MTKAKKAIGVILAVVMIATMFAFGSFAAGAGNATFTVEPSATQVEVGDTITVSVKLTTDYYAGPTSVPIYYNAALFDYVAGSLNTADIFGAGATDVASYNNNGCLTVAFVPKSAAAGVKAQVLNNVTLFSFRLTAKANGVSPVELKAADQKAVGNMTGKLYCGSYANASVTSAVTSIGQTFTLKNSSVQIGSVAAAPELVAKAGTTGVVDSDRGYVYGVTAGTTAADYFEATNGGTVEWAAGTASSVNGTGATVTLKDASGAVVSTYTLIIFGDLNGDGNVDSTDSAVIMQKVAGTATLTDVQTFAGDLNADGNSDSTDSAAIMQKVAGTANVTVNPYA